MSFGFSVGDFIAAAELAHTLYQSLSTANGSAQEYRELVTELNIVHKVLLQVNQLQASNQFALATTQNLLFVVATASGAIESFLVAYQSYGLSLREAGSGNVIKDIFRKGSWAIQMPKKVDHLRRILSAMLASINCLVTLTCYYNSGYDPSMSLSITSSLRDKKHPMFKLASMPSSFRDVDIQGIFIYADKERPDSAFQIQTPAQAFFRPGQVFSLKITTRFWFVSDRPWRQADFGKLPLESAAALEVRAKAELEEDKKTRRSQILQLPLASMIPYSVEVPDAPSKVHCKLCTKHAGNTKGRQWTKDEWIDVHFRTAHRDTYRLLREAENGGNQFSKIISSPAEPAGLESMIMPEQWFTPDDVTTDRPIHPERVISQFALHCSPPHPNEGGLDGPVLIRRFIVVRSGPDCSLCIGIHTYGGRGCGSQLDQQHHAILHSSKYIPTMQAGEEAMCLQPIRMKPEHPSTALPRTARIHFGRAYVVPHTHPVMSLGLIHAASMEMLLTQFEEHVFRGNGDIREDPKEDGSILTPMSLDVAKDIRRQIDQVLSQEVDSKMHIAQSYGPKSGLNEQQKDHMLHQASEAAFIAA